MAQNTKRPQSKPAPTLRERAASLKAGLMNAIGAVPAARGDQPQPASLPDGHPVETIAPAFPEAGGASHDASRGYPDDLDRDRAAGGHALRLETTMGRHETFENGAPIAEDLLTGTTLGRAPTTALPEPGSAEAKAAFLAACGETDRLMQAARDGYPDLLRPDRSSWTKDSLDRACDLGEITPAEYGRLYRLAAEREHRMEAAVITTDIGTLWGLAHPEEFGRDRVETVEVPTVSRPDPILAAIAAAREAERYAIDTPGGYAENGTPESEAHDDELDRRTDLSDEAHRVVFGIMPATPAGLLALVDFAVEQKEVLAQWDDGPDVLGAIRAGVATHLGSVREMPGPDPVLAVLERFWVMRAEHHVALVKDARCSSPEDDANEAATATLADREDEAWSDLVNTQPTSLAGLHAKIRFMGAEYERFWDEFEHADVFDTIAEAVVALMGPGGSPETNQSDEPQGLATAIMESWRAWHATQGTSEEDPEAVAAYERAYERRHELLNAAEALPATPDHFLGKALALVWLEAMNYRYDIPREEREFPGKLVFDVEAIILNRPKHQVSADADAALIVLETEFLAKDAELAVACDAESTAGDTCIEPEMPVALQVWRHDWIYNSIPRTEIQTFADGKCQALPYGKKEVEALRANPCMSVYVGGSEGEMRMDDAARWRPDPQAQKRADAIVAAWDEWQEQTRTAQEAVNLPALTTARKNARAARDAVLQRMRETPAHGLAGLAIKARVAANMLTEPDIRAAGLELDPDDGDAFLYDLAGDVLALTGGLPAAHRFES